MGEPPHLKLCTRSFGFPLFFVEVQYLRGSFDWQATHLQTKAVRVEAVSGSTYGLVMAYCKYVNIELFRIYRF
jgi:hypothetical protein